eukprot:SAG11_NODE_401_length_9759_cov_119.937992_13_plen_148_part_00
MQQFRQEIDLIATRRTIAIAQNGYINAIDQERILDVCPELRDLLDRMIQMWQAANPAPAQQPAAAAPPAAEPAAAAAPPAAEPAAAAAPVYLRVTVSNGEQQELHYIVLQDEEDIEAYHDGEWDYETGLNLHNWTTWVVTWKETLKK